MCFEPVSATALTAATAASAGTAAAGTAAVAGTAAAAAAPTLTGLMAGVSTAPTILGSTTLGSIGAGLSSINALIPGGFGTILSGAGMLMQNQTAYQYADMRAEIYRDQMRREMIARRLRELDLNRERDRFIGRQKSQFAASGVDPLEGSAVDVLAKTADEYARKDFADAFNSNAEIRSMGQNIGVIQDEADREATGNLTNFVIKTLDKM